MYNIKILLLIILVFVFGPIIKFIIEIIYRNTVREVNFKERYGDCWIMITGASGGQGKKLAIKMAQRGFNIIMIGSKNTYKTKKEIKKLYPHIKTKVIIRDFSKSLEDNWWDGIEKLFDKYDIGMLINNVGRRTASKPSHEQDDSMIRNSLITGTYPQIRLTNLALKKMVNRKYKSAILFNTAQCIFPTFLLSQYLPTGEISVPYMSVYEATNAFGYYHANSLLKEYNNIDMLIIMPGAVITENTQYLKEIPFSVDVDEFCDSIIRMIGNWNGATCVHWKHDISSILIGMAPFMKDIILKKVGLLLDKNLY
jgi:short-subunit dehydrogenase